MCISNHCPTQYTVVIAKVTEYDTDYVFMNILHRWWMLKMLFDYTVSHILSFWQFPMFPKILMLELHSLCFCIFLCHFQLLHTQQEYYGYFNSAGESMNT